MKMTQCSHETQLIRWRARYARRNSHGKTQLLDEFCEQYDYSRKHAIKLLRNRLPQPTGHSPSGAPPRYDPIGDVVEQIWRCAEQPCGKRLVAALPLWLPHYPKHFNCLLPTQRKLLGEVSAATLDRLLVLHRAKARRGLSGTKPGSLLRTQVPIQGEVWQQDRVGFLEADSVAHCGDSLAGNFVWSLTYTDMASTWTEGRAVWNKGAAGVLAQTRDVEASLPFALRGFDFDNGSEWLNWHLIRHLQQRRQPVAITRSRPYHKDDNAHVEQKNWMWPRQLLGYGRLGQECVVVSINTLYKEVWGPLQNFFLPSMKLQDKWREGSRWVRRHGPPQTAYQRLRSSRQITQRQRQRLHEYYESLDPFILAQQLEQQLKPILQIAI
jgi:hypothetical protein